MEAQSLENNFSKYWSKLSAPEKESLLVIAKNYVHLKLEKTYADIEQYNKEVNEAIARVETGEYYTHEEVVKMAKEW